MPNFLQFIKREGRFFLFSRSLLALVFGALSWPVLLYCLDFYDSVSPIKEDSAFSWVLFVSALSIIIFLLFFIRYWIQKPSVKELAKQVEQANPDLLDLLNCAVELEEASQGRSLTFMEKRVLNKAEQKAQDIVWSQGTRPKPKFWIFIFAGVLSGAFLSVFNLDSSPLRKSIDSFSDESGLIVFTTKTGSSQKEEFPSTHEFSRGTDVSVFADVTRGHRGEKLAFIEFEENNDIERLEMLSTPVMGRFEFVVPSLQNEFAYRVVTPSLESEWQKLSAYDPPSILSANWQISPPAYMKMENLKHEDFGYARAPEGSKISLELTLADEPENVGVAIYSDEEEFSVNQVSANTFRYEKVLNKEWSAVIRLRDLDATHREPIDSESITFAPIPDEPPIVEITDPAKDLQLEADAGLLLEVFSSDDHGVADVRINISHAGEKEEETIFVEPIEKEKTISYVLDLSEMALAVGDVITYMALAMDNKEPDGQIARSEIYFIEILPPEGNSTDSDAEMDGEQKEIPVRDFINKTKKIIRSTYDALLEDELRKEKLGLAISTDALGLKNEMTKVFDEFEGQFPVVDGIDLGELLNEATYHIEQTEIYAGDQMLDESLDPSEKTLRKLVQIYALMQKMQKQKAKGKGVSKESKESTEEPDEKKEETSENPGEKLKELAKDLDKLKEFKDRQNDLNRDIGRSAGAGKKGEQNQKIAQEQEDLRRDVEGLRDEWYNKSGSLGEVSSLDQAGEEMKDAAGELRRDSARDAQPHGDLAAEALGQAISEVEAAMAGLAAGMVDQLKDEADSLSGKQRQLGNETEGAQSGEGEGLKDRQEGLNGLAEELLEKIDQTARSMGGFNENATEDLLRGSRDSREKGLERSGKRAANSLLYEAFPQAKKEEDKVAENLEELSEDLQGVADKLRNLGNGALRELVEELQKTQEGLPGMSGEELKEKSEELAKAIGSLPNAESDQRLQNLTQFFEQVAVSENPSQSSSMASAAVSDALELMQQFFWKQVVENRLRQNQETTAAPSRYKKQVEEYFRRIAEGE
jgi:hypothetical protein